MLEILEIINIPRVVATVHQAADLDHLAGNEVSGSCDLLEFRLDSLRDHLDRAERAIAAADLPCIITARHPDEGGDGKLDPATRAALLTRFLPHASLIDIEVRSLGDSTRALVESAKDHGVGLIASFHDFEKTPSLAELERVFGEALAAGADVTKIAFRLEAFNPMLELVRMMEAPPNPESARSSRRLSLMGMGPLGKLSRLVFASAGSCLNYGYLRAPNAPGQWPAAELKRLLAELWPESPSG